MATKPEALKIAVVHGPNLNLLGTREPDKYGTTTLPEIDAAVSSLAAELGASVTARQSNVEGELVDYIQEVGPRVDGFLINAAAYTHTSIAIRDVLLSVAKPFVEVHLSNVHARESYRHHSYLSDRALGVVVGFGKDSYLLGLRGLVEFLQRQKPENAARS